jgi:hypothetical protein
MKFRETSMYWSVYKLWAAFSRLNPYSAVLAAPAFVVLLVGFMALSLVLDFFLSMWALVNDK